jgi:hypothetical protein
MNSVNMSKRSYFFINVAIVLTLFLCVQESSAQQGKINGLSIVAPPTEFANDPFPRIMETYADWVCLIPYGYSRIGNTDVRYNLDRQWWGEREEGIRESIALAQKNNLKIFLKPQVYVAGAWPGDIEFDSEEDWLQWEKSYREFILFYADIASDFDVEMFCIGTEFKKSVQQRPQYWKNLIKEIRDRYCGKLTYSANWDSYKKAPFWDALDYIGISAYFPLVDEKTPPIKKIKSAWKPIVNDLSKTYRKYGVPILFTEYGYLTVDGTTYENWKLEKKIGQLQINEKAQADALDAMYSVFSEKGFWAGGFLWKWFPNNMGHEGYMDKDYTPKDKMAEDILKKWFQ